MTDQRFLFNKCRIVTHIKMAFPACLLASMLTLSRFPSKLPTLPSNLIGLWTCVRARSCVCFLCSLIPCTTTSCSDPIHFPCQSTPSCYGGDQRECVTVSTGTPDELWPSCLSVYFLCLSGSESLSANWSDSLEWIRRRTLTGTGVADTWTLCNLHYTNMLSFPACLQQQLWLVALCLKLLHCRDPFNVSFAGAELHGEFRSNKDVTHG